MISKSESIGVDYAHKSFMTRKYGLSEKFAPLFSKRSRVACSEFRMMAGRPRILMYMISPANNNSNLCHKATHARCSPYDFLQAEKVSHEYSKGMCLACPMIGSLGGLGGSNAD